MNDPDRVLDLTGEVCPMTFVRTRLALDALPSGALLAVLLRGEEPVTRVPRTVVELGHEVLGCAEDESGVTRLVVRKA